MADQPRLRRRGEVKLRRRRKRKPQERDKFTKKTRFIIYKALRQRLPISTVCAYANISEGSFNEWMDKGAQKLNANYNSPRYNQVYVTFYNNVNKIMKEVEEASLRIIEAAERGGQTFKETKIKIGGKYGREITKVTKELHPNWQAAAWFLERTRPAEYNPAVMAKTSDNQDAGELALQVWEAIRAIDNTVPEEEEVC